ncbi:hypothetical protein ABZY42_06430 [Streptomyces sp. NPDC006622]|uniref:hypothetical protein n=1 Tax=Streptomyces sp. NPDC006622 TaxID=3155459 RepID=UPI0033B50D19
MSSAFAGTDLLTVMPDVSAYGYPADPAALSLDTGVPDVTSTGVPDLTSADLPDATALSDHAGDAVGHLGDAVGHVADQLHDMIVPAVLGLADLSGALLVTRLALRGTVALAAFNNKVAVEQEALSRRQASLETASACWRRAAEAAAGINARITVLGLDPSGPGDPPPPAPVQPVGVPLDLLWKRLAETDRVLRRAEAQHAARATARLPFDHARDPEHADWYDRLRERRRQTLIRYAEGGPAPETTEPERTALTALTEDDVLREGADLLAGLPLAFTSAGRELIDDCLREARRAVGRRPTAVRRYLDEAALIAHKESERALLAERARQDAALRLGALQAPAPEGVDQLPDASEAVTVLRRALRDGVAPSGADERTVRQALMTRSAALQRAYLVAALRRATERWGEGSVHARMDAEHWDFAPAAWGGRYWLRVRLTATGQARVFTMRRPVTPEEEADPATAAWDAERCAESSGYVEELGRLTEAQGVRAEFAWSSGQVRTGEPAPGLTESGRKPSSRRRPSPPRHQHHDH